MSFGKIKVVTMVALSRSLYAEYKDNLHQAGRMFLGEVKNL